MEFEGRIIRVFPTRTGTSQRGEWKALPFVFAYYENPDQRWEDKVLLETFDTNVMAQIAQYCEIGTDKKAVVENGSVKLKTLDIKCKCGFSHNAKDITTKSGEQLTINEMKCYKLEVQQHIQGAFGQQVAPQSQVVYQPQQQQTPFPPQAPSDDNDLPF